MQTKTIIVMAMISVLSIFAGIGISSLFRSGGEYIVVEKRQTDEKENRTVAVNADGSASDGGQRIQLADSGKSGVGGSKEISPEERLRKSREEAEAEIKAVLDKASHNDSRALREFKYVWEEKIVSLDYFRLTDEERRDMQEWDRITEELAAAGNGDPEEGFGKQTKSRQKELRDLCERINGTLKKTRHSFFFATVGCRKAIAYLVETGFLNVNRVDNGGCLHLAAAACDTGMIDYLLDMGASINLVDKDGQSPLSWTGMAHWGADRDEAVYNTVWHMIDRGALLKYGRHRLDPARLLQMAAKKGDIKRVKQLVENLGVAPEGGREYNDIVTFATPEARAYLENEARIRGWDIAAKPAEAEKKTSEKPPVPATAAPAK